MENSSQKNPHWIYSATVKDHFFHPRNAFQEGENFPVDGEGEVGSPACGDLMKILIQVDPKKDAITACRWSTFGCASAIASTSMLSVMITENGGMKIGDALKLRPQNILERLGGLPTQKIHCSVLGDEALREAILDYFRKTEQKDRLLEKEKKLVCACKQVTNIDIETAVLEGANTLETVQKKTGAGTVCAICIADIEECIEKTKKEYFSVS